MAGVQPPTHDVFLLNLSESGTTKGYSGDLLKALDDREIHTFTIEDVELLPLGEDEIPQAIQASKIAIVVVTGGNYHDVSLRRWNVLIYILDYFQRNPQRIIPVYYMDRSHAHDEPFTFEEPSYEIRKKKFRVETANDEYRVSRAIAQLDNLPGWDFDWREKNKDEFNREIASQVSKMIYRAPLPIAVYPVGLESRLEEVWSHLELRSSRSHFLSIGFFGVQGIGKSVLARAVYNSIAHLFEVSCFLDLKEISNTQKLLGVQKKLLSEISGESDIQLKNVDEGVSKIKNRLSQKDVLLILDNVGSLNQLEALGRGPSWELSSGSRVIITARDKHLLRYHGDDMLPYEVQALNDNDALELLRHRAFEHGNVDPILYTEVLNRAIKYAFGNPLVLDKIGSFWKGKSVDECNNALVELAKIRPHGREGAFTYDEIQRIRALTTSGSDPKDVHISLNDTGSNAGFTSQMGFKKWMLILVFVATNIAGLLCDFLSPHFKSSIRWWTLVRFFPLVLFILAFVAIILYVTRRQTINDQLIKCCICYGIFLFISVYSYFYDRAVDGKPEKLSVISNAMFALASLGLSRLFEAGFETGIFNYFLQCFLIQLLTIHWWLIFVAIIVWFPFFDWHFSAKPPLITRIAEWFGINPVSNQNQNDKKAT